MDDLTDRVFDKIAEGRHTLRVLRAKPPDKDSGKYFVSFMLSLDSKTHDELRALGKRQERCIEKVIHRFVSHCFKTCLADDDVVLEEQAA